MNMFMQLSHRLNFLEYIGLKKKRPQKARHHRDHRGTRQEFIDRSENEARNLGSIRPVTDWNRERYAKDMFLTATDERMLHGASKSLKGEAAGVDGVRPEDIARYTVYRQWCEICKLFGHKRPAYRDTIFPDAPWVVLFAFSCLCRPGHMYKMEVLQFDMMQPRDGYVPPISGDDAWRRFGETMEKLRGMSPDYFLLLPEAERNAKIASSKESVGAIRHRQFAHLMK